MNPNIKPEQDELSWRAFCYVAGEFSPAEAEQFEARLATDQAAREAVAEAVELLHAVCAAEASEPVVAVAAKQRTAWSQKLVWISSGAIAAALLVVAVMNLNGLSGRFTSPGEPRNVAAVSPALADAWSAVRSEYAAGADDANSQMLPASAVLTDAELALAEEDLALSTDAPSWMTAAVMGLSGDAAQPLDAGESVPQEN